MILGRRRNDHSFNLREPSVPALVKAYIVSFPDRDAQQVVSKQRAEAEEGEHQNSKLFWQMFAVWHKQQYLSINLITRTFDNWMECASIFNTQINAEAWSLPLLRETNIVIVQHLFGFNFWSGIWHQPSGARTIDRRHHAAELLANWRGGERSSTAWNEPSRWLKLYIHGENLPLDETQVIRDRWVR